MTDLPEALLSLTPYEARTATAIFERLFPADAHDLGATAIGVVAYLDRALAGAYHDHVATYHLALAAFDQIARQRYHAPFADCTIAQQDALLAALEQGALPDFLAPPQREFFTLLCAHLQEGLFAILPTAGIATSVAGAFSAILASGSRTPPTKILRPRQSGTAAASNYWPMLAMRWATARATRLRYRATSAARRATAEWPGRCGAGGRWRCRGARSHAALSGWPARGRLRGRPMAHQSRLRPG